MIKVRRYSSIEEVKQAFKEAVDRKETIYRMFRQGAKYEDFEAAGIHLVRFS